MSDISHLREIEKELIGKYKNTTRRRSPESAVSRAKAVARKEGRDPAIDPEFQYL